MDNTWDYGDLGQLLQNAIGQPIKYYTVFTAGQCANSYMVNNTHVVKIPFEHRTALMLRREIAISKVLKGYNLPFQTPVWREHKLPTPFTMPSGFKTDFCAVRRFINGYTPSSINDEKLMPDLGKFFARLHKIPPQRFIGVPSVLDLHFEQEINILEQYMHETTGISPQDLSRIRTLLASTILSDANTSYCRQVRPVLCHHDLHKDNILVNDEGYLIGVLDFGTARIASAITDLNLLKLSLSNNNFDTFMTHYSHVAKGVNTKDMRHREKLLSSRLGTALNEKYQSIIKAYIRE